MGDDMTLAIYLKEIRKFPLMTPEREKQIVVACTQGDVSAREELINSNLRLVVNIAKKYTHCGLPLADLVAEGNIGLLYAVERVKPTFGSRFSTYATFWIKHTICHAITDKNSLIRIPAYMKKILSECKKKNETFFKQWGHLPLFKEMVELLNVPDSQEDVVATAYWTNRAMEGIQSLHSLHETEFLEDFQEEALQTLLDKSEIEWLIETLKSIEPKRAQIIKLRYGLDGNPTLTLKEIAYELRLTKERIRQIEKETLKLLRKCLSTRNQHMQYNLSAHHKS